MKVLLTGATGFVGQPLVDRLGAEGHQCLVLSRYPQRKRERLPAQTTVLDYEEPWPLVDAVINLAGESIVGLWTPAKRRRILQSRVETTRQLVTWMAHSALRPHTFISMSAVGFYGDRPGEHLTEGSAPDPAQKFRARVTRAWEAEARQARSLGVRVVTFRLGNVLHPAGGYLGNLLRLYHRAPLFGFGAPATCFSWISRQDAVRLLHFSLHRDMLHGPLNATAPHPVTLGTFTRLLATSLDRRAWGRVPGWLLKLALGEFSSAFLDSQAVYPEKALAAGFAFTYPALADYLAASMHPERPQFAP